MPKIFVVGSYNTGLTIRVPRMPDASDECQYASIWRQRMFAYF